MGKLEGKVAFITGAARGQGRGQRSAGAGWRQHHRRRHLCADRDGALPDVHAGDLAETVKEVEALDRRSGPRRRSPAARPRAQAAGQRGDRGDGGAGDVLAAPPDEATPDPAARHRARRIAARLAIPAPRRTSPPGAASGHWPVSGTTAGYAARRLRAVRAASRRRPARHDRTMGQPRGAADAQHGVARAAEAQRGPGRKLAAPLDVVVLEPVLGGDPAKGQL